LLQTPTATERRLFWMVHRALPPITAAIIVFSSALEISHRKLPKLGLPELAMTGYILLSLFSIWELNSKPLATSYLLYDRVIIPVCLYLIVRFTIQDGESARKLLPVLIFLAISQSIIGILSWYLPQVLPSDWLTQAGSRTTGSLVNASVYTTTLTLSGLLVLHAGLTSKDGPFRKISILTFYLASYCIFISFSRASWLGGIFMLLGLLYLYPRFTLTTSLVVSVIVLVFGGWLLADQIQWAQARFKSAESERSALSRLPVYYASLRMFQAKPMLGWGYANFDQYDRRFQGRVADLPNDNKDHASHNLYLTTIAEQGILGLGLFLAPMIWLLILSLRAFPRMPVNGFWSRKLLVILWLVILSHLAVNNFSNMRVVFGLGMWWITLGLVASLVYAYQKPNFFTGVAPAARPALRSSHKLRQSLKISK
jgi:O-antigen ligase